MRDEHDAVLEAEQDAAARVAQRRRTLRDAFLDAQDRRAVAVVTSSNGELSRGAVSAVAADHVTLDDDGIERIIVLDAVVTVELR